MIEDHTISDPSKIRLVLLYALRYERMPNNAIKSLVDLLDNVGVSEKYSAVRMSHRLEAWQCSGY